MRYGQGDPPDRVYRLQSSILGYRGIGGDIDGIRNPILEAKKGETVQITIVNSETLAHDIAMEAHDVKSPEIVDEGATATITFVATQSDTYYCTIPGHRQAGMEGRFQLIDENASTVAGLPIVKDGRIMNLDFETGTFADWTAEGDAFGDAPVEGDVLLLRTGDTRSQHTGSYWVSSNEANGHRAKGSLTSDPFTLTQPFASFRLAGGALGGLDVEIIQSDNQDVLFSLSGYNGPTLRPVIVDLTEHVGNEVFIRLTDTEDGVSGLPYIPDNKNAYIAFDDFLLYSSRPDFTNALDPKDIFIMPPILEIPNAGLSGEEAAAAMEVPEGFSVTLAAAEPDVIRPIAFTHDDRGRLWVAEAHTYPEPAPEGEGRDRILIMEDTNGDGTLDSRKVFIENINLASGIEYGFGGIFVGAAPYLLFIPIDESGDQPAGEPQILLDGWGTQDTHEVLNSLRWGPDGWLYGAHGVFTHSNVGKPGTPDDERVKLNAGVWRYHPTTTDFELWSEGTSNPWGIDFNANGHPFVTACVIPHLYHMIPGARYQRQYGQHFNPYVYDDIPTHADHVHWIGEHGPHAGNHRSDEMGGGHAHAGAMFYLGGSWPEEYHNKLFMNNIHGFRANVDVIERSGSGYVGRHGEDFLFANDSWSQMLNFRYGPDGAIHVIDWYDKNQCHSPNPDVHDKTLGRIFKVAHENDTWVEVDLSQESSETLAGYMTHANEWYVRTARRILQERGADEAVHRSLSGLLNSDASRTHRLRALWTLYVTAGLTDADLLELTYDQDDVVRSWAVQLIANDNTVSAEALARFATMARNDSSQMVRLYLASALQRVPVAERWPVLAGLYTHEADAEDHNLPLMIWYAAEPAVVANMDRALTLALDAPIPLLLSYTIQRIADEGSPEALRTLARRLEAVANAEDQRAILKGLNAIVSGDD